MIKTEIRIFFTAIMFYTRVPVPKWVGYSSENLNKATRYFPMVGILVGGIGAVGFWAANQILPVNVALLFSMGIAILLTGAFHEDAISDFCDGFGGGYSKEKILTIMKDSRIGTYGAIALFFVLLSKFMTLSEIKISEIPWAILAAHAFSRLNPVLMIYTSQYVREDESAKNKPIGKKSSVKSLIIALIFGLTPLFLISAADIPFIIISGILILLYFRYYVHKKIGGYTGDVLGALQQISEITFYVTYLVCSNLL